MLQLLILENKKTIQELEIEINTYQQDLERELKNDQFELFHKELKELVKDWDQQLQQTKVKKKRETFLTLTLVGQQQSAYNRRPRTDSMSSVSSIGSSIRDPPDINTRHHTRKKRKMDGSSQNMGKRRFQKPGTSNEKDILKVINLSDVALTETQTEVLSLGLSFSPFKNMRNPHFTTREELEALQALEEFLQEQETLGEGKFPTFIIPKSKKCPPLTICPAVEIFVKMVTKDFKEIKESRKSDNLTKEQRQALKELRQRHDMVIKSKEGMLSSGPRLCMNERL